MKITRKDIITYRKVSSRSWHDSAWRAYMDTRKAEAIGYAEDTKDKGDSYRDISMKAERYLDFILKGGK